MTKSLTWAKLGIHQTEHSAGHSGDLKSSLDFERSKRNWFTNDLDIDWDLKTAVWYLDKWLKFCQELFEWFSFRMVGNIALANARIFENQTIWNTIFKNTRLQRIPDFDWSDFRSPLYLE